MNTQTDSYQKALEFFGPERMKKIEEAASQTSITKQLSPTGSSSDWVKWYAIASTFALLIIISHPYINQTKTTQNPTIDLKDQASLFHHTALFTLPQIPNNTVTEVEAIVVENEFLVVEKGDTLSTIAEKVLLENGIKNNFKNRQALICALKNKNQELKDDDYIRQGWKLKKIDSNSLQRLLTQN